MNSDQETTSSSRDNPTEKLKVFISYSRADMKFADELVDGLEFDGGFDVTIDRHSIKQGEEWEPRLGALIEAADTVVFVLSPDSAQSEICQWEVDEAERLKKRLVPVLHRHLGEIEPPKQLGAINYIDFTQGSTLMAGIKTLATALKEDLGWLKESTRLLNLALDWERAERRNNRLLSGKDIDDAKQWIVECPKAAALTELHRDYIKASELEEEVRKDEERKRLAELAKASKRLAQRTMIGMLVTSLFAIAATGIGFLAYKTEQKFRKEQSGREEDAKNSRLFQRQNEAQRTDLVGQIISFGTSPGFNALDALEGSVNSPYTNVLLRSLNDKTQTVTEAITKANNDVLRLTNYKQRPYYSSDMNGEIFLWKKPKSRRIHAIVVSIDKWGDLKLVTPRADALAWKAYFEKVQILTTILHNPTYQNLDKILNGLDKKMEEKRGSIDNSFIQRVGIKLKDKKDKEDSKNKNTVVLFIYTGPGVRLGQKNFIPLWPLSTNYKKELGHHIDSDYIKKYYKLVEDRSIAISDISMRLRNISAASVMIIDSGFSSPFPSPR